MSDRGANGPDIGNRPWPCQANPRPPRLICRPYFGRTLGSPPGLPGGGITGILPVSGAVARICGSTLDGGHNVPSDLASLSPSASLDRPTVAPSLVVVPVPLFGAIGAQLAACGSGCVAVCAGGVAGEAGACACAALASISTQEAARKGFVVMAGERGGPRAGSEPIGSRFAVADQREMAHRRHRPTLGERDAPLPRCPFHPALDRKR